MLSIFAMVELQFGEALMKVVSSDFEKNFDLYADKALIEPVTVTGCGREDLIVLSWEEYVRLVQMSRRMDGLEEASDSEIDEILDRPYTSRERGSAGEVSAASDA